MNRIFHHYEACEDSRSVMWQPVKDRKRTLQKAIRFTRNTDAYGKAMLRVVKEWPKSCEHFLTNPALNKQAWIGHAACALEKELCEEIVREAWSHLSDEEQAAANKKADEAIALWGVNHAKKVLER